MASSIKKVNEPFVRVRLVRFAYGKQNQPLQNLKLRVDTFDELQISNNRPRFPEYDAQMDRFCFETRTKQGRQVTIGVYLPLKNTSYTYKTTIEELIRHADEIIREYQFSEKSRGWMSIELIAPENLREAQRIVQDRIRKHYGHEFISKYFMNLPVFCAQCRKILWGFNTPGYRCQLCELVVHEQCINHVATCKNSANSNSLSIATTPHNFLREPNFLPAFCDHDGRLIRPLRAWKCSECGMIVHSKCKINIPQFCGTRQVAVELYEEWKEQNKVISDDTYISSNECRTVEMEDNNRKLLMDIYGRLDNERDRYHAIDQLNRITRSYQSVVETHDNSSTHYYNASAHLLHELTFYIQLGRGMSGSVYWVKHPKGDFALKAIRKHRIFEANEYDCVQGEREILMLSRQYPLITRLYAVFHDFQRVYFLLEHAPCGNFYDFLKKLRRGFDNECIQWFSGQILCAIRFLHSKLIIHRDLKPENVLLLPDGSIKLADFGFSKKLQSAHDTTQTFCGTTEYIAPEIYQYFKYSFPVDFWSLGVMIYEMTVLNTPFYHSNLNDVKDHVIHGDFHCPDHISPDLREILIGLLRKNPRDRFGIYELQASRFYSSSTYSLDQIERRRSTCPWKWPIPLNPSPDECSSIPRPRLSDIDEQSLCTTLTVNKDQFRDFSFIDHQSI